jgi:Kdo2-lipid IVA lauroyltransferase/acyltransferase
MGRLMSNDPYKHAPKRKARDPWLDARVHALAQALILFLNVLPGAAARALGRGVGRLLHAIDRRHRKQVLSHLTLAFRDTLSDAQKKDICARYFEHTGLSVIEFARLKQLNAENVDALCDLSELKRFDELLKDGKGLLCVPAHHGNWELCGYAVALKGYPLQSVARPLDNPLLNEMVRSLRETSGNRIVEKWKVLWKLKKLLDKGGIVTMSVDQNGGVAGLFVPMFGVLASTVTSPAELHLASRVPIVIATMNRQQDGVHHKLHIWDVIRHAPTDDRAADIATVITRINAAVEKAVRAYPEQWLWVHKRWKTRPPGEKPGLDGLPPRVDPPAPLVQPTAST